MTPPHIARGPRYLCYSARVTWLRSEGRRGGIDQAEHSHIHVHSHTYCTVHLAKGGGGHDSGPEYRDGWGRSINWPVHWPVHGPK